MQKYYFTSESVSEGHPDKVADQISDAILDAYLAADPNAHVACETLCTTDRVVIAGEIKSSATIDVDAIVRNVIREIGYVHADMGFDAETCVVENHLHQQSSDIDQGVSRDEEENQGAGDQGIMFGYATDETSEMMPVTLYVANKIMETLARIRKGGKVMRYLRPDSKSQVTVEYCDGKPVRIDTIVVSTQHADFDGEEAMHDIIERDVREILMPLVIANIPKESVRALFGNDIRYQINPTGKFVIGGPAGDTGLTGRKIIVDTYGGWGAHGGGAFSGKDPSKVDRSAAYAARHIAKNLVALGVAKKMLVQLSYAIGVAEPVSVYVNTYGTARGGRLDGEIADYIKNTIDLRPAAIIKRFDLKRPLYKRTAAYGHFGKQEFPWERLDWDVSV